VHGHDTDQEHAAQAAPSPEGAPASEIALGDNRFEEAAAVDCQASENQPARARARQLAGPDRIVLQLLPGQLRDWSP
jgi:hypothetical protein